MPTTEEVNPGLIRQPAVANAFYSGDPAVLKADVTELLQHVSLPPNSPAIKAIIAPHAGYIYSGPVAASVYARVARQASQINRVVLIGPSHRVPFTGCAVSSAGQFATPLGNIRLDRTSINSLIDSDLAVELDEAHAQEHSLEVHLPFLQTVLGDFSLVPVVVGNANPQAVSRLLSALWGGEETLIVVSTDLSHFHDYETAKHLDLATCAMIESLDINALNGQRACGYMPVSGLLHYIAGRDMKVTTIDYRNSGDTAGSRDQVVGYVACTVCSA